MRPVTKKILTALAGIACLLVILSGCSKPPGIYKAGSYTATMDGYGGGITVEVEFDGNSILSVKVVEENETKEFGTTAISTLPGSIVEAQTYDVAAVSSATVTSEAIKAAVKDCIEQALVKSMTEGD
jgi:fumarate reductase flavoprotein subunit